MSDWKPIKTCPYGKEVILGRDKGNPGITSGFRIDKNLFMAGMQIYQEPTHWMPLPSPPKQDTI
ncbi:DUF551 domain-containing protein [Dyadobacter sp. CY327]|uniref:DUF551 domain-containing protein n=1 Tax=Dyadobacter sp. CY327 TaxID=2907301 RepID=UPI001F2992C1|nr:DUF551 domain-containing protein [Dyadobacter sp. CY327]MCE7073680.1 DUF551 domain-containing protein [Dyadobacter sp. CY327]